MFASVAYIWMAYVQVYSLWLYLYGIRKKILKSLSMWALWNELWHNSTMKFCATEKRIMKLFMCWDGKMSSKIYYYLKKAKCKTVYITCICICLYFYKDTQVEDTSDLLYSSGRSRQTEYKIQKSNFTAYLHMDYFLILWAYCCCCCCLSVSHAQLFLNPGTQPTSFLWSLEWVAISFSRGPSWPRY